MSDFQNLKILFKKHNLIESKKYKIKTLII